MGVNMLNIDRKQMKILLNLLNDVTSNVPFGKRDDDWKQLIKVKLELLRYLYGETHEPL